LLRTPWWRLVSGAQHVCTGEHTPVKTPLIYLDEFWPIQIEYGCRLIHLRFVIQDLANREERLSANIEENQVMTVPQVAEFLQFSEAKVYRLLKMNELPGVKIGGQWRMLRSVLEEYMRYPMSTQRSELMAQTKRDASSDK